MNKTKSFIFISVLIILFLIIGCMEKKFLNCPSQDVIYKNSKGMTSVIPEGYFNYELDEIQKAERKVKMTEFRNKLKKSLKKNREVFQGQYKQEIDNMIPVSV